MKSENDAAAKAAIARITELIPEHWQLQQPSSPIAQIITACADTLRAGKISVIILTDDADDNGGEITCKTEEPK